MGRWVVISRASNSDRFISSHYCLIDPELHQIISVLMTRRRQRFQFSVCDDFQYQNQVIEVKFRELVPNKGTFRGCLFKSDRPDLVIVPLTHSVVLKQRSCYKVKHHRTTAGILWLSWNSPSVFSQGVVASFCSLLCGIDYLMERQLL